MKSKLRSLFTENIGMKLLAIVIGVAIWAILYNAQDPTITRTISIPINYTNEDQLLAEEQHVLLSGPDTVQISCTVRQSNQGRLRSDLFTCTADLMDHGGGDLKSQRVHVSVQQVSGWDIVIDWTYYRGDPNITVAMDDYIEKTFDIGLLVSSQLTGGLILKGTPEISPESVTIAGPLSRFSNIASVKAILDLEQLRDLGAGTYKMNVPLKLYDANDNVVTNADGALKMDAEEVQITAVIVREGAIQVRCEGVTGTPAEGYRVFSVAVTPDAVSVHGVSNSSDFNEILIPAYEIDVTGISQETVYSVDISKFLPDGVTVGEGSSIVQVTVNVEQLQSLTVNIPLDSITIDNQQEGYTYTLEGTVTPLYIHGFSDALSEFSVNSLVPWVTAAGLEAGRHSVRVNITRPSGYLYDNADELYVILTVTAPETQPSETQPPETQPTATPEESSSSENEETEPSSDSETEDTGQPDSGTDDTTEPEEPGPENG
ncbi:MAG: hypothetical protein IJL78_03965 [Lachnospiraceae bacterium]|nr:hypothetical protein [Lachnospiraceae bacterium]